MKVYVYGMGYVGCVSAVCLASLGNEVIGVDIVESKIRQIERGRCPVFEPRLDDLLRESAGESGRGGLRVILQNQVHFDWADVSIVCVGTPSMADGQIDLNQIRETASLLGRQLRERSGPHTILIRSTVPPGTTDEVVVPILEEESGKKEGEHFSACFYPEFLREGCAVEDFFDPSLNLLGGCGGSAPDLPSPRVLVDELFRVSKPALEVPTRNAEMIKYASNSFHALKVAFANEIAVLSEAHGVDGDELMRLFASDTRLNISPAYLRPGPAFGGSCLPKELRAVSAMAKRKGLKLPLLDSVLPSNSEHAQRILALIEQAEPSSIGFLGVTFKPNTDDTRESPVLNTILALTRLPTYRRPARILVCDGPLALRKAEAALGAGVTYHEGADQLFEETDVLVLGPRLLDDRDLVRLGAYQGRVIDLKWHILPEEVRGRANYHAIC